MRAKQVAFLCAVLVSALGVSVACAACGSSAADDPSAAPVPAPDASTPGIEASAASDAATSEDIADAPQSCSGKPGGRGEVLVTLTVGSLERTAHVYVPSTYDATRPTEVIFGFHGFTKDAADLREISHLDLLADARNYIVVFAEGRNGSWNAGSCCGVAQFSGVDDIGFVKALVAEVAARWCTDPKRTFAAGFSNGGFLAHRLGCEMADTFAAIGVVAGEQAMPTCAPPRPVPVLQIHGTSDPIVPYNGNPLLGFPSTRATVDGWRARNGCGGATIPVLQDGETTCTGSGPCMADSEVILCTVEGGVHDWPGGGGKWTGATPPAGFVASLTMLDFFGRHPM